MQEKQNDFTKNSMAYNIMSLAIPMTIAQLINVLYSLVDRMYIGHLAQNSTLALTGLGITFPIIMLVTAVTNLFGMGGAPLCSIARGRGDDKRAEKIIGNSFAMLIICSCILIIIGLVMKKSLLYLFGASDETYPYANEYFSIYIWGSIFVMVGLGMNTFINAQGFAKKRNAHYINWCDNQYYLRPYFYLWFRFRYKRRCYCYCHSTIYFSIMGIAFFI